MKKLLSILLLTILSFSANADIILKYGLVASDTGNDNNVTWAGLWGETDDCKYCIALFALETYDTGTDKPLDLMSIGIGF